MRRKGKISDQNNRICHMAVTKCGFVGIVYFEVITKTVKILMDTNIRA